MSLRWATPVSLGRNKCRMARNKCRMAENKCRMSKGGVRSLVGLLVIATATAAASLFAGCSNSNDPPTPPQSLPGVITVSSHAFGDGQQIPPAYTCDGAGISPPLRWSGLPAATGSIAIVVDDPDAPGGTFVHWVVADIPSGMSGVGPGQVPEGGVEVTNSSKAKPYFGPCPPSGTHHYRFSVYALPRSARLPADESMDDTLTAIYDHAIASGRLVGLYTHRS
jgi:Raf kinase inhibitor-like YbhB/YbcL family protein